MTPLRRLTAPVGKILREKKTETVCVPLPRPAQSLTTAPARLPPPNITSVRSVSHWPDTLTLVPKLQEEQDDILLHWIESVRKKCFASLMFGGKVFHTSRAVIDTASGAPTFLPEISVHSNVGLEEFAGLLVGKWKS